MAIEYNFTLDMDRSKRDNNIAYARTGDVDSITINADLVLNGAAYTPSGTNAFFECVTPNGHSVRAAAEKTGSSVSVEVPSAAFQAAGVINVAYFRFETGEADNPTYVESTEPFAIVVREGIGDNIDVGDYIEEWRQLADQLEAIVAEVEQKAEQAETAINEQKTEVDQLKAQAQKAIAGDVTEVEEAAQSAIAAINQEKADVANAAEGITEAGEQAINTFNTNSQQALDSFNMNSQQAISKFNTDSASAISKFNSDGASAISQFNSKGTTAIDQFNTNVDDKLGEVDDMITEAQGDVDAAVTQLKTATDQAVSAMEDALDGTTAGSLQNAINRTLKLDVADMTDITSDSSLSSFTNAGSYCCKTATTAATIGDCPIDDSPFNMYVFSSATSGQVMQLVVPIDLNSKPTAEWHVRFGTSSAMDPWSVIGGGADIAAGLGIDVAGDAQKTVSLDTSAFYEHVGLSLVVSGSTEVTGGGRTKEVRIKGRTVKNLWPVIAGTQDGLTIATDETGLITVSGTATAAGHIRAMVSGLAENKDVSAVKSGGTMTVQLQAWNAGSYVRDVITINTSASTANTGTGFDTVYACINYTIGETYDEPFQVMLVEGDTAPDCFVPTGLHSVEPKELVTAGKNLLNEDAPTADGVVGPQLQPGDYALSGTLPIGASLKLLNGGVDGETVTDASSLPHTFTVGHPFTPYYAGVGGYATGLMLELGSAVTAYEPPNVTTTPLPEVELRSLSNGTCDELVINADGTCEVERRTQLSGGEVTELPEPTTEPQTPVTLPVLPASTFNVYATGGYVPVEIEAEVVKVDYLPPSDVYTKEEVDKKIEDVGGMPEIVPVSQGGTGATDAATARTNLGVTPANIDAAAASHTHSAADVTSGTLPVSQGGTGVTTAAAERNRLGLGNTTGALPVANGGTGATDAKAAQYSLLNGMAESTDDASDTSKFIMEAGSPSAAAGAVAKRSASYVWNWIVAKIRSTFGFSSSNVLSVVKGGTGSTSAKAAQNSLLNDMNVSSDALTDSSMLVGYNTSPSASNGAVHKRSVSTIWDYIASKIRSTFGFDSSNVLTVAKGGTGVTTEDAVAQMVFSHAPEASPTQAGVVKTLSDQDFCEYMGIDYNPDDWS